MSTNDVKLINYDNLVKIELNLDKRFLEAIRNEY